MKLLSRTVPPECGHVAVSNSAPREVARCAPNGATHVHVAGVCPYRLKSILSIRFLTLCFSLFLIACSLGGGGSENTAGDNPQNAPAAGVKSLTLEFSRIPNATGLDKIGVVASLFLDGTPKAGLSPVVTLEKGTRSPVVDNGDGTYSFTVTATMTGEHPVKVCYDDVCVERTPLVFKEVHADWDQPMSVAGLVNTDGYEDGVTITPDGRYLFTQTGPMYASGTFVFRAPRAIGGCGNNRLVPDRCTHKWIDEVVGPYTAPERPGFHDGRIGPDGTLLHNSIAWGIPAGGVTLFSQATMFYGFKRQEDGSFAEPFYIAFDDQNDGLAGPFGMSFVMTGPETAKFIFSYNDGAEPLPVDTDGDGTYESKSGFDIYTLDVAMGVNTSLGELVPTGTPGKRPVHGAYWPIKRVNFSDVGTDGIFGTQGNGHLFDETGVIKSIWTDDEFDRDADAKNISVYTLVSGNFPDGTFEKTVLPPKINKPGASMERQPFFTGTGLFFARGGSPRLVEVWYASYSGPQTAAGYADGSNWGTPVRILKYDEKDTAIGSIVATGEPTVAKFDGKEYLYFAYIIKRGVDPVTGLNDLNFQAGYVKQK